MSCGSGMSDPFPVASVAVSRTTICRPGSTSKAPPCGKPGLMGHQYRNRHVIEELAADAANQRFAQL
jgi:hypothetical protein